MKSPPLCVIPLYDLDVIPGIAAAHLQHMARKALFDSLPDSAVTVPGKPEPIKYPSELRIIHGFILAFFPAHYKKLNTVLTPRLLGFVLDFGNSQRRVPGRWVRCGADIPAFQPGISTGQNF
jgi:hypothetical protein